MAAVCGLTVVKAMPYRTESLEEWSNTYHFAGAVPVDDTSWMTLANQVIAIEKPVLPTWVKFQRVIGHATDNPSDPAVFSHDFTLTPPVPTGTYSPAVDEVSSAGDQAAFAWWKMNYKSSKGKPVYLRKYLHAAYTHLGTPTDLVGTQYAVALQTYAQAMTGVNSGLRSQAKTGFVTAWGHGPYITTRTLKRRGKKKNQA